MVNQLTLFCLKLFEVELLMNEMSKYVNDEAHILFGVSSDQKQGDNLSLTIISSVGKPGGLTADIKIKKEEAVSEETPNEESSVSEGELPEPFVSTDGNEEVDEEEVDEEEVDEEAVDEEEVDEEESVVEQQDLLPEKRSGRGRFEKAEPSVTDDGEDLDVPSFLRKKKK